MREGSKGEEGKGEVREGVEGGEREGREGGRGIISFSLGSGHIMYFWWLVTSL